MDYEEKIKELNERITKLEKIENRRKLRSRIKIIIKFLLLLLIIILLIIAYDKYVKPYKEKIEDLTEKIDTVENFNVEDLKKYIPFLD